jgi:AraC family transcriptional regulator
MPAVVSVPLGAPPRVVNAGIGVHGVGPKPDVFVLPKLWQLHLYPYSADYFVDGEPHRIRPGCVSLVAPGTTVEYRCRAVSQHYYVHFDSDAFDETRTVPVLQPAGILRPLLAELMRDTVVSHVRGPKRASASVWTVLHRFADLAERPPADQRHPAVDAALAHIEAHLVEPLSVAGIARDCGISHNHLTRLFRAQVGSTVVAYIHQRRMQRAQHLLADSTLPVLSVAAACGIPDLQAFNKACRRAFGMSPRLLREAAADLEPR